MANTEEPCPEGVYWVMSEGIFRGANGKSMGGAFFEKWKDRRDEFPVQRAQRDEEFPVKRRRVAIVPAELPPNIAAMVTAEADTSVDDTSIDPAILELAQMRKAMFDAYLVVGFSRDEALELCTK